MPVPSNGSRSERQPLLSAQTMERGGGVQHHQVGVGKPSVQGGESAPAFLPSAPRDVLDISTSPAYAALNSSGLIVTKYQIHGSEDIVARPANSSPENNACINLSMVACFPLLCCIRGYIKQFTVEQGTLKLIKDGRGGYEFCSAGVHQYKSPWLEVLPVRSATCSPPKAELSYIMIRVGKISCFHRS
jgi:hypothetical protein